MQFENISLDEGVDAVWEYNADNWIVSAANATYIKMISCFFVALLHSITGSADEFLKNSYNRQRKLSYRLFWILNVNKVTANNETKQEKAMAWIGFFKIEMRIQLSVQISEKLR